MHDLNVKQGYVYIDYTLDIVGIFFSWFALMSYLIPISLAVTVELARMVQSLYMYWDEEMTTVDGHMRPKTSNLNDELCLVKWVFSDKTGTLTENRMEFARCSIRGHVFDVADTSALFDYMQTAPKESSDPDRDDGTHHKPRKSSKARKPSKAADAAPPAAHAVDATVDANALPTPPSTRHDTVIASEPLPQPPTAAAGRAMKNTTVTDTH
jgi:magnesium-transporting ATPase (P-type)